jgi:hypothetical protein
MSAVSWRRLVTLTSVAFIAVALVLIVTLQTSGSSSVRDDINAFNACIGQSRFLALTKHESDRRLIEKITDRTNGHLAGEFAAFPSARSERTFTAPIGPPSGNGAANGRLLVVTAGITGRDANAIIGCERAPAFPLT